MKRILLTLLSLFLISKSYCQSIDWLTEIKGYSYEEIRGTAVSPDGSTYISGYIESTTAYFGSITIPYIYGPRNKYFTAKCDSSGNFVWVRMGGDQMYNGGASVTLGDHNNIYTTGYCDGNATFDNLTLNTTSNVEKSVLLKFDANGNIKWGVRFGGNGYYDEASGECVRYSNGYVYDFARRWGSSITVYNQPIIQFDNCFQLSYLVKFDTLGNFILAKRIAGSTNSELTIRDVVPVKDNFIVTGFFQENLSIDTIKCQIPYDKYQSFIAKYNSSAELLWFKRFSSSNSTSFILAMDIDSNQNIIATGVYSDTLIVENTKFIKSSSNYYNSFICKMDSSGNLKWIKDISGPGEINSVALSQKENRIYISGYYVGYLQTGNLTLSSLSGYNLFILEFDDSGNIINGKTYGKTNYIQVNDMGINVSGNLYLTGQYLNSTTLGPYVILADSTPGPWNCTDGFIFKYNPNENPSAIISGEYPKEVVLIYPNPCNGILNVRINGLGFSAKLKIQIINSLGIQMHEFEMNSPSIILNCNDLNPGIYFIRIIDGKNQYNHKFIME